MAEDRKIDADSMKEIRAWSEKLKGYEIQPITRDPGGPVRVVKRQDEHSKTRHRTR